MTPLYKITARGEDVTSNLQGRLISLSVTDEDGDQSDSLSLEIDDAGGLIAFPETGKLLDVSLGFAPGPLSFMGQFSVDTVSGSAMPRTLSISATAAGMKGPIRAPRTRNWTNLSLRDIVGSIAADADLKPVVGRSIAATRYAFLAQTAESNLHFLTRIARDLDATAKPAGGHLVVVRRDEGVNASGDAISETLLAAASFHSWSWELKEREDYKKVDAEWRDIETGALRKTTVGSGEPSRRLRHAFATEAEAKRAATSELAKAGRAALTVNGALASFFPDLFAGGLVRLSGLRSGVDGTYLLRHVEHRLQGALTTSFRAERSGR